MSFVQSTLTCQTKLPALPLTQLAAAAAATADAAAAAAAMEITRLEHALERMTDQPLVESKAFCPAPRELEEVHRWVKWCRGSNTSRGTNTTAVNTSRPAPTPTPTAIPASTSKMLPPQLSQISKPICRKDTQVVHPRREHPLASQPASSSAQPSVPMQTPNAHEMSERTQWQRSPQAHESPSSQCPRYYQHRPTPTPTPTIIRCNFLLLSM